MSYLTSLRSQVSEQPALSVDRAPEGPQVTSNDAEKAECLERQRQWAGHVTGFLQGLLDVVGEPGQDEGVANAARAAEWIEVNDLHVAAMAQTHDSAERAPKGMARWFDAGADLEEAADYGAGDEGIVVRPLGAYGEAADGGIRLYCGATDAKLREVLAHEVQHLVTEGEGKVDRPDEDVAGPCADRAGDDHFAGYYGEFEAYWATGTRLPDAAGEGGSRRLTATTPDGRTVERTVRFANARQLAIFEHLCGGDTGRNFTRDARTAYWYVPYYVACDPTFAGFVEGLTTFAGANALDSVRIDRLLTTIEAGGDWCPVVEVLTPDESAWLLDESGSAGFWARVEAAPDGSRVASALRSELSGVRALVT